MLEIRDLELEKNKLAAERDVLAQDVRVLYGNLGEARVRKDILDGQIEDVLARKDEIAEMFQELVNDTRDAMQAVHEFIRSSLATLQEVTGAFEQQSEALRDLEAEKQVIEDEIVERRKLTKQTLKDLDIYADRLTKAYEMIKPNQKIVVGDKEQKLIDESKLKKISIGPKDIPQEEASPTEEIPINPKIVIG